MIERIKAAMTTAASMIMTCLSVSGVRVQSFMYFENWRRREDCKCPGCNLWRRVDSGEFSIESVGIGAVQCQHRHLAWKDKTLVHARWNPLMACLWIAILSICFVNMYASIGVVAIVTTAGKNDLLTQYFKGSAYTATWFIGLVDGGSSPTYAAADTMASHAGWTENVTYSNANRVTWTGGSAAAGSIDNSASPAAFTINGTATVAGSFMVTNSTKSGSTGTLYSEANFTQGNRAVVSGDTLNCTATETAA